MTYTEEFSPIRRRDRSDQIISISDIGPVTNVVPATTSDPGLVSVFPSMWDPLTFPRILSIFPILSTDQNTDPLCVLCGSMAIGVRSTGRSPR